MLLSNIRELYPGLKNKTFLDAACVGLVPITAQKKINDFIDMAVNCYEKDVTSHHLAMDQMRAQALIEATKLFKVELVHLALIENTTQGLNIAANAIDFQKGDEVIICNTEYLQVAIPFIKKQEQEKLSVIELTLKPGQFLSLKDFAQKITKNTKAICISAVMWCTGQRVFTKELGELCKEKDIWLIVDGVQEAGCLNVDMNERYCDFYIAGGHKWLNAPFGCGILYMSKRAISLEPPSFGYLNLEPPFGGWGHYFQDHKQTPFRDYYFPKEAKSFETGGTANYPGAIGLGESIGILNKIGMPNIEDKIKYLANFLHQNLKNLNIHIYSPLNADLCSGINIFRLTDDPIKERAILSSFLEQRIFISIRYTNGHGGFRVSTHYFNNEEDILRLCHKIKSLKS